MNVQQLVLGDAGVGAVEIVGWLVAGLVVNISSDRGHTLVGARVPAPAPWKLKIASLHPAVARGHSPDSPLQSPSHHRHHDHTQTGQTSACHVGA